MKPYRDFTQNRAVGSTHNEWKKMARLALDIRNSNCSPVWAEKKEREFTGIFKRLLIDPIEDVQREAR